MPQAEGQCPLVGSSILLVTIIQSPGFALVFFTPAERSAVIGSAEEWDADYFHIMIWSFRPITIAKDLMGEFQFGMVQGQLNGRIEFIDGLRRFEFSGSDFNESDLVTGCGWLRVDDSTKSLIHHPSSIRIFQ